MDHPPHRCETSGTPDFDVATQQLMTFLMMNGFNAEQAASLLTSMAAQIAAAADLSPHELVEVMYQSYGVAGGKVEFTG